MTTLFQKFRTAILSTAHSLVDKVIDLNSIGAIKQHIRDLEEAKEKVADDAAIAKGRVKTQQGQVKAAEVKISTTNENIDLLLSDSDTSNDKDAEKLEARLIEFEEELSSQKEELAALEQTAQALAQVSEKLNDKHREMLVNLRRLESLERTAAAKEQAASALQQAGQAGAAASAASVDNVERRLRDKATVADARLDRAMGEVEDSVDSSVQSAQARQRLAERRARLQAQKSGGNSGS